MTSFAYLDEDFSFVVLAHADVALDAEPGRRVIGARVRNAEPGQSVPENKLVELEALRRFPDDAERDAWARQYQSRK